MNLYVYEHLDTRDIGRLEQLIQYSTVKFDTSKEGVRLITGYLNEVEVFRLFIETGNLVEQQLQDASRISQGTFDNATVVIRYYYKSRLVTIASGTEVLLNTHMDNVSVEWNKK